MVKFGASIVNRQTGKPGQLIGIGLSADNMRRLKAGQPISFALAELFPPDLFPELATCEVLICGGETEADIKGQLAPLIGPATREFYR